MYNLAVIDDELLSRKYILSLLNECRLKFTSVMEAKGGNDAMQKFTSFIPDIMLVDIRMPDIDGLSLIKMVRETVNPRVKTIIISGYSDFEYSRQAIQLGVKDYLLKPINKSEFYLSIQKVFDEMGDGQLTRPVEKTTGGTSVEMSLNDLLDGKRQSFDEIRRFIGESPESGNYVYTVIDIRIIGANTPANQGKRNDKDKLKDLIRNSIADKIQYILLKRTEKEYVILAYIPDSKIMRLYGRLDYLLGHLKKAGIEASIGVSNEHQYIEYLPELYKQASIASRQFLFEKGGSLWFYASLHNKNCFTIDIWKIIEYINENFYNKDLTLEKVSSMAHISKPYFCSMFKKATGKNFVKYVNELRIEMAKELLVNSSLKIYELSEKVGYTNVSYFLRIFKNHTSMQPKEYRRQCNEIREQ